MKIFDLAPTQMVRRKFTVEWTEENDRMFVRVSEMVAAAGGRMRLEQSIADFLLRQLAAAEKEMKRAQPKFSPGREEGQDQI